MITNHVIHVCRGTSTVSPEQTKQDQHQVTLKAAGDADHWIKKVKKKWKKLCNGKRSSGETFWVWNFDGVLMPSPQLTQQVNQCDVDYFGAFQKMLICIHLLCTSNMTFRTLNSSCVSSFKVTTLSFGLNIFIHLPNSLKLITGSRY